MKRKRLVGMFTWVILAVCSGRGLAQLHDEAAVKAWGTGVSGETIAKLVTDRTWHMNWSACMGGTDGCSTYWDFLQDGTMCARAIDAQREDACADEGRWRIEDNALCWDLSWMGGGEGYKSTCILIKENDAGAFETTRARGIGLSLFEFTLTEVN